MLAAEIFSNIIGVIIFSADRLKYELYKHRVWIFDLYKSLSSHLRLLNDDTTIH